MDSGARVKALNRWLAPISEPCLSKIGIADLSD